MTKIDISRVITSSFIQGFRAVASGVSSAASAIGNAATSITANLRAGARIFSNAVQNVNAVTSFFNVSKTSLEKLSKITDQLITLTERAAKSPGSGKAFEPRFAKLAAEFRKVLEDAKLADKEALGTTDLSTVLTNIGLDPIKIEALTKIFDEFVLAPGEDALVSEKTKAKRPIKVPDSAFRTGVGTTQAQLSTTKVSNNAAISGAIASDYNLYGGPDNVLLQNPLDRDAVLINQVGGATETLEAGGGITYTNPVDSNTGTGAVSTTLGDFNQDGEQDLITANTDGKIAVMISNGNGAFNAPDFFESGINFISLDSSDINNDGKLDIVGVASDGQYRALLGNGNGSFKAPTSLGGLSNLVDPTIDSGPDAEVLLWGDFNRDGKRDLATASSDGKVNIFLGNGDGSFKAKVTYDGGDVFVSMTASDVNDDGVIDLFGGTGAGGSYQLLLGNSDGSFNAATSIGGISTDVDPTINVGTGIEPLLYGDYNRDGKLDFATTGTDGRLSVFLGNGDGSFKAKVSYNTDVNFVSATTDDVNRDGVLDVVGVDANNNHRILLGNSNGSFKAATSFGGVASTPPAGSIDGGTGVEPLLYGDFNRDGKQDLITASTDGRINVFTGNGDGSFNAKVSYNSSTAFSAISSSDLNGDGVADLVGATTDGTGYLVMFGNSDGSFKTAISLGAIGGGAAPASSIDSGTGAEVVLRGDFNRDGKQDLLTADTAGKLNVFIGNGDGSFDVRVSYSAGGTFVAMDASDVNEDGVSDVVGIDASGVTRILLGNSDGSYKAATTFGGLSGGSSSIVLDSGDDAELVLHGDFNRDGKIDLVTVSQTLGFPTGDVNVYLGNGNGTFNAAVTYTVDSIFSTISSGDVDGDGITDLLGGRSSDGQLMLLRGNSDGSFKAAISFGATGGATSVATSIGAGTGAEPLIYGDFNTDGNQDFITASSDGRLNVILGNGDGSFKARVSYTGSAAMVSIASQDLNEDGVLDVVGVTAAGKTQIFLGNSNGTFKAQVSITGVSSQQSEVSIATGNNPKAVVFGQGAVYRSLAVATDDGKIQIQIDLSGNGTFTGVGTTINVGSEVISMAVNDLDGDGLINDLIAFTADGRVLTINGDTNYIGTGGYVSQAGVLPILGANEATKIDVDTPNTVVEGDFNDDGIVDLAVSSYDSIEVLVGLGNGSFAAAISLASLSWKAELAVDDFNGDGVLDLVAAPWGFSTVLLFSGNGDGTFNAGTTAYDLISPYGLRAADLNGDGKVDIANILLDEFHVRLGNGDGTFSVGYSGKIATGSTNGQYSLELVDFDRDGDLDALVAGSDSLIYALTNDGAGNYSSANYTTGVGAVGKSKVSGGYLTTGDFDRDGKVEIAIGDKAWNTIQIYEFSSGVTFTAGAVLSAAPVGPIQAFDYDRDGDEDLVFATTGALSVMLGNGDGTFAAAVSINGGAGDSLDLILADLDGDGRQDIVSTKDDGGSTIGVLIEFAQTGAGYSATGNLKAPITVGGGYSAQPLIGDFNRDGIQDLVQPSGFSGGLGIQIGNGDGTFKANTTFLASTAYAQFVGDFNQDGKLDIVGGDGATRFTLLGNGDGTFSYKAGTHGADSTIVFAKTADFNQDGKLDLVSGNFIYIGNGDGTFKVGYSTGLSSTADIADVNGDGKLDLIGMFGDPFIVLGNGDGTFNARKALTPPSGGYTTIGASVGDYDNDGALDIMLNTHKLGFGSYNVLYKGNGDGSYFAPISMAAFGTNNWTETAAVDFNRDGNLDFISLGSAGTSYNGQFYLGNGDGTFKAGQSIAVGSAGTTYQLADLNRDGILDFVENYVGTTVYLGNSVRTSEITTPTWRAVTTGDINGDDQVDIVYSDANSSSFHVLLGNGDSLSNGGKKYTSFSIGGEYSGFGTISSISINGGFSVNQDDDSYSDLAFVTTEGKFGILLGNGTGFISDGTFKAVISYDIGDTVSLNPTALYLASVDNNEQVDAIIAGDNALHILYGNTDGSFKAAVSLATGGAIQSVSVADYNGDGFNDIAALGTDGNVRIFVANSDGSLNAAITRNIGTGGAGGQIVSSDSLDLDGDGRSDFIVTSPSNDTVNIMLAQAGQVRQANGTFKAPITTGVYGGNALIPGEAADFNNDGFLDIVSFEGIALGNGDGTFKANNTKTADTFPDQFLARDFNSDGKLDLWINQKVFLGNGDGSFSYTTIDKSSDGYVAYEDLDEDGVSDLIVDNGGSSRAVLYGNSDGSFDAAVALTYQAFFSPKFAADFDSDGFIDLIDIGGTGFIFARGNGDGSFDAVITYADADATYFGSQAQLVDINGDGNLDLLSDDIYVGRVVSALGNGDGSFQAVTSYQMSHASGALGAAAEISFSDITGDGNEDLVIFHRGLTGGYSTTAGVYVAQGNGNGSFKLPTLLSQFGVGFNGGVVADFNEDRINDILVNPNAAGYSTQLLLGNYTDLSAKSTPTYASVKLADVNRDGSIDIIATDSKGNYATVQLGNGNGTFKLETAYKTGDSPETLEVRDVNRDGKLDLVTVSSTLGTMDVLLGNGDGSFESRISFAVGNVASGSDQALSLADVNDDGVLDAVVGSGTKLQVLLGNSTGTFKAATSYDSGASVYSVEIVDYNRDGNLDLITSGSDGKARVSLGNGDGSFSAATSYAAGTGGSGGQTAVLDIDRDGQVDLATVDAASGTIVLGFAQTGAAQRPNGIFEPRLTLNAGGTTPQAAITGDFNEDGIDDFAVSNYATNDLSVFISNGDGTFNAAKVYFAGLGAGWIDKSDFNQDGNVDLVVADSGSDKVSILLGNGNGTFKVNVTYSSGNIPNPVEVADYNQDGITDIATVDTSVGSISIQLGNGDGTFKARTSFVVPSGIRRELESGDFNGDGTLDLVATDFTGSRLHVLLGNANGTFKAAVSYVTGTNPLAVTAIDVNRDGILDLIGSDNTSNTVSVYLGNGDGSFKNRTSFIGGAIYGIRTGDFNGDGLVDFVAADKNDSTINFYSGNGDGSFNARVSYATASAPEGIAIGDFNADGVMDVIAPDSNGGNTVSIFFGSATALSSTPATISAVQLMDINQDGNLDTVATDSTNGTVRVGLGNGNGSFKATVSYATGATPESVEVRDINHDGNLDVLSVSSTDGTLSVLLGNGDGSFKARSSFVTGSVLAGSDQALSFADVNEDGDLDALVASGTKVQVLLGNANGSFSAASSFENGTNVRSVEVADYNRDGALDLITSGNDGKARVMLGNADGSFKAFTSYAAGTGGSSAQTTVADLDGDGQLDLISTDAASSKISLNLAQAGAARVGDGTFKVGVSYEVQPIDGPVEVFSYDLNDDGILDLAYLETNGVQSISVMMGNGDGSFTARFSIHGLSGARDIQFGDANNDGTADILVNAGPNGLGVLLGNGDGTYNAVIFSDFTGNAGGFKSADFNGDGKDDLIVNLYSTPETLFMQGNGDGTYNAGITYSEDVGLYSRGPIEVGDFNEDGKLDFVSSDYYGGLSIFIGNGDGSFKSAVTYQVYTDLDITTVKAADFNKDGTLDLVYASSSSGGRVGVVIGNGNGTFKAAVTYATAGAPNDIYLADYNGDGRVDLLTANFGSDKAGVLFGNADGSFSAATTYAAGSDAVSFTVGDFNRDGALDFVAAGETTHSINVLLGNYTSLAVAASLSGSALSLRDVNQDGQVDVVTADVTNDRIMVQLGNGNGTFKATNSFAVGDAPEAFEIQDVNHDGKLDIVSASSTDGNIKVLFGNGNGTYQAALSYLAGTVTSGNDQSITLSDVNEDGNLDAVVGSGTKVQVLLGNADGSFKARLSYDNVADVRSIEIADYDRDGALDLITAGNDGKARVMLGNGDGSFKAFTSYAAGTGGAGAQTTFSDLDGDGQLDLVSTDATSGKLALNLAQSSAARTANGTFKVGSSYSTGKNPVAANIADFNGDGIFDIVSSNLLDDTLSVLLGNADGSFKAGTLLSAGSFPNGQTIIDANRDGHADIISIDLVGETFNVFLSNGDGSFLARQSYKTGGSPYAISAGDLNGDGKIDLVTSDFSSDEAGVYLGNGDGTFNARTGFKVGSGPRTTVLGDFDSDGRLDIASSDNFDNTISLLLGNGDGTFKAKATLQAGLRPEALVTADVNNDGTLDLISADIDDSVVSVFLGNGNGTFNARISLVGNETSLDLADVNGDGRLDLLSADGFSSGIRFGNGDGSFTARSNYGGVGFLANKASDVNRDGVLDIVGTGSGNSIQVLLGNYTALSTGANPVTSAVDLKDLNHDGQVDIVATDTATGTVKVRLGNGNGTFKVETSFAVGANAEDVIITDVNHDGDDDLVAVSSSDGSMSVLFGNGDGSYKARVTYQSGNVIAGSDEGFELRDINQDGNLDAVVGTGSSVNVLLGNADGSFKAKVSYENSSNVRSVQIADYNRDGSLDVITSGDDGKARVMLGNGNGSFKTFTSFAAGTGGAGMQTSLADLDGDGQLDLATTDATSGKITFNLAQSFAARKADGTFKAGVAYATDSFVKGLVLGDFNSDGVLDFVTSKGGPGDVFLGNGDGTFKYGSAIGSLGNGELSTEDVNQDGILDLVGASSTIPGFRVALGVGDGTFGTSVTYVGAGTGTSDLTLGDINSDGAIDVILTDYTSSTVSVALGNGDGSYKSATSYSVQTFPSGAVLSDFNRDGSLDLVVAGEGNGVVSVLLGNGDGTFDAESTFDAGQYARVPVVGDFDQDGFTDLAVTDSGLGAVNIYLGNGDGTFAVGLTLDSGISAIGVSTSDINGDGVLDLVASNALDDKLVIFVGNGDGTFKAASTLATGDLPRTIALGDLNNDGVIDILHADYDGNQVVVNLGNYTALNSATVATSAIQLKDVNQDGKLDALTTETTSGRVQVQLGNGDGSFEATISFDLGTATESLEIRDIDQDGKLDVVSVSSTDGTLRVALGNGNGTFKASSSYVTGNVIAGNDQAVALDDVNNDGVFDAVVGTGTTVRVLLGNADGSFAAAVSFDNTANVRSVELRDYNRDGAVDIITAGNDGKTRVFLGNGNGTYNAATSYAGGTGGGLAQATGADFDGDGQVDLISTDAVSGLVTLTLAQQGAARAGAGTFKAPVTYGVGALARDAATGDFNGDGKLDFIVPTDGGYSALHAGDGAGGFTVSTFVGGAVDYTVADFDGDGALDLIATGYADPTIWVTLGNGDGTFKANISYESSGWADGASVGDFNDDGNLDLLIGDSFNQRANLLLGNGDGSFLAKTQLDLPGTASSTVTGDFNRDGKLDFAVGNQAAGDLYIMTGNGDSSFSVWNQTNAGVYPKSLQTGDFNRDGILDIVAADDYGSGQLLIFTGVGDGTFSGGVGYNPSNPANKVAVTDFNRDGKLDLVSANISNQQIEVMLGNGDGSFSSSLSYATGGPIVSLEIGDFNADGADDVVGAMFNANSATVLFSNLSSLATPIPFNPTSVQLKDVNGDGQVDIVSTDSLGDKIQIQLGNGDGTFKVQRSFSTSDAPESVQVYDINRDGKSDLVLVSSTDGSLNVLIGNGDGTFKARISYTGGSVLSGSDEALSLADVNGDGITDALVGSSSQVQVLIGNSDGSFNARVSYQNGGSNVRSLEVSDYDRDGQLDVVTTGDDGKVRILLGNTNGSFNVATSYAAGTGGAGSQVSVVDLDGDGTLDFVASDVTSSTLTINLQAPGAARVGDGTFKAPTFVTTGNGASDSALVDFDRDGDLDYITTDSTSNSISLFSGNGDGSFDAARKYSTGIGAPANLIVGDYNNDGIQDFIASDQGVNGVFVFIGNGDGEFAQSYLATTSLPTGITAGDFNNDGNLDFAQTHFHQDELNIFLGNGDGTFNAAMTVTTADQPTAIYTGDFNNDGVLDLAAFDHDVTDSFVAVYLGNGDGSYKARQATVIAAGYAASATDMVLADYDRDGDLDIGIGWGNATFLMGNGDGTFGSKVTYAVSIVAGQSNSGDFNGDGITDFLSTDTNGGTTGVKVIFGNADGSFTAPSSFTWSGSTFPASLAVGDINRDGVLDFITTDGSGQSGIFLGNATQLSPPIVVDATSILLKDLNEDGKIDIIATDSNNGQVHIQYGNGNGSFKVTQTYAAGAGVDSSTIRDVDNDGDLDILTVGTGGLNVLLSNGDGSFKNYTSYYAGATPGGGERTIVAGDLNRDGIQDIAISNGAAGENSILLGNADGSFNARISVASVGSSALTLADFDRDGILDLIETDATGGAVNVSIGNGNGTFNAAVSYATTADGSGLVVTDIDRDGQLDLISIASLSNTVSVHLAQLNQGKEGTGSFGAPLSLDAGVIAAGHEVGDFNEDGNQDFIIKQYNSNSLLFLGNGDGTFKASVALGLGGEYALTTGDINNDGHLDIFTSDSSGGHVTLGNGDGTFLATTFYATTGGAQTGGQLFDVNNDGNLDFVTSDYNNGTASVYLGNGDGSFKARVSYYASASTITTSVGDVNGDGKLDLVTTNFSGGANSVEVLVGNGDGSFKAAVTYATGTGPIGGKLFDVDQDGDLDIVTYAGAGGTVSVLLANGDGSFNAQISLSTAASRTDRVSFADLNHDGKIDLIADDGDNGAGSSVFFGNGDGTFLARTTFIGRSSILTDFNNDGILDTLGLNGGASSYAHVSLGNYSTVTGPNVDGGPGNDVQILAVNKSNGYSVIQSNDNFLSQNNLRVNQLFLVNTLGVVVHQFTNETTNKTFESVDITSDNRIVYNMRNGSGDDTVRFVQAFTEGADPSTQTVATVATTAVAGVDFSRVQVSDDGNYIGFLQDSSGTSTSRLFDSSLAEDAYLSGITGVSAFDFIDSDKIALVRGTAGAQSVSTYTYSASAFSNPVALNLDVSNFTAVEKGAGTAGYFGFVEQSINQVRTYKADQPGSVYAGRTLRSGESISQLSLALDPSGRLDIGLYGNLNSVDSDTDNELYRVDTQLVSGETGLSRVEKAFDKILDTTTRKIGRRPDAYRILADLKELKKQITTNLARVEDALGVLKDTSELLRISGVSFLDASNTVKDSANADAVARQLQQMIKAQGAKYLEQASNLEPSVVVALLNSQNGSSQDR